MIQEKTIQRTDGNKNTSFRDRHSNTDEKGRRKWVFALKPQGRLYKYRNIVSLIYLIVFLVLPFIIIDGQQFFQLNIPDGKFTLFGKIFWPDDFLIFAVGMIVFVIFIALFTVIYGRIFCGWVCPQTVFMEFVFRKIEWWIEGSPARQKKLKQEDWTGPKLFKKMLKHSIFLLISFIIANTFLAYIVGSSSLLDMIQSPVRDNASLLIGLLVFTLAFYFVFAFVRDIVCTTVCPYGRLQSVLFDKDTMQVSYDYKRGEPRGKLRKNAATQLGDCIDCTLCVQVCPTNIDIRDGVQMECIGCTACIDACNGVMQKIHKPLGLIRMASENEIAKGIHFRFTPRMKAYTALLVLLTGFMLFLIISRKDVNTTINRAKGQLFIELGKDSLSNLYEAKLINKTTTDIPYELVLENIAGRIRPVSSNRLMLKKEAVTETVFFIDIPRSAIYKRSTKVKIGVYSSGKKIQTVASTFLGPFLNP